MTKMAKISKKNRKKPKKTEKKPIHTKVDGKKTTRFMTSN